MATNTAQEAHNPAPPATSRDCLTQRVLAVCDAVGAFIEWWGFKAIHGRIWVLLCLSDRPLSQRELSELLEVSKALISTAIAELTEYRLVRPTSNRRNAPYEANMDVWATISDILRVREWMILERVRQALEAAVQEAERAKSDGEAVPFSLSRLHLLLSMTEVAQTLLKTLLSLGGSTLPDSLVTWIRRAGDITRALRG